MEITFIAHASFKLRGNKATVVTDPFDPAFLNLKFPKVEADIVTISHEHADHNYLPADILSPLLIQGPGEYESKGVNVIGVSSYHDDKNGGERGLNTIYRIEMDGISLVHLGDLGYKLNITKDKKPAEATIVVLTPSV